MLNAQIQYYDSEMTPSFGKYHHHHHHHHHHHISVTELGHLLTRSGLTYPEVSSNVCHDSFCRVGNSVWEVPDSKH